MAIGARDNGGEAGHVRVFDLHGNTWTQVGADIDGENLGDWSGSSVSLSSDGSRLAIAAFLNDGGGHNSGHVRVFELNGSNWVQIGADIDGEAAGDRAASIALSSDGTRVAIGAHLNGGNGLYAGSVRVFEFANNDWNQIGADIDGEAPGDQFGWKLALSSDGARVAIGSLFNDGNGPDSGSVRVFEFANNNWNQIGADIDGEYAGDQAGSVALSSDGARLAIGAAHNSESEHWAGHVRVFELQGGSWNQMGMDIDGNHAGDVFGDFLSMSSDGTRLAIASNQDAGNGASSNVGHVRIFDWSGSAWIQVCSIINGESAADFAVRVALSADGSRVAIGADRNDGNGPESGHVRAFHIGSCATCEQVGTGCAGLDLSCSAPPVQGMTFQCVLSNLPMGAVGTVVGIVGPTTVGAALPSPPFASGCFFYLGSGPFFSLPLTSLSSTTYSLAVPANTLGVEIGLQGFALNTGQPFIVTTSNALEAVVGQ